MTMMQERPMWESKPMPNVELEDGYYMSQPVLVDRQPDGDLHLTAMTVKPDALIRVGHRAMVIAQAMIDAEPGDPPELFVEVVVHYL